MRVIAERDLDARMRDGTVLRADVYRPDRSGQFPVVLQRTPYDKRRDIFLAHGREFAENGYVAVFQDVRGRYASDGELKMGFFSADHHDTEDGYDTVEWAAGLPWSNGRVGTFGSSYGGWTQWAMAHTRPPHLVTMIPGMIAADLLDRELSGVLRLGRVLSWCVQNLSADTRVRAGARTGPRTLPEAERLYYQRDREKWLWFLPLSDLPEEALHDVRPLWLEWLGNHAVDTFRFLERHSEVNVPALSITAWYDQQIGTIKHFTGMSESGMTEDARSGQRLIIGPWTHGYDFARRVGEVDFGPEAKRDYVEICLRWFDYWLKQDGAGPAAEWPPVQLFVMGANRWRGESEWPLARTEYTRLYLHSSGSANTQSGDGTLSAEPPGDEPPDRYVYDPRDPLMTLYSPNGQQAPYDQRALDGRQDVLVYRTPPLEKPVEVTGPVTVKLHAASSARDTDWVVKLIDVWPGGFAQEVCHGILRARYRDSYDSPSLLEPDRACEFTVNVNPTSNLFKAGHRIRVDITSSDFPNFDRNHNTGGNDYFEADLAPARQTVFHDAGRPSHVVLPVIP